jgi:hypothetical protein
MEKRHACSACWVFRPFLAQCPSVPFFEKKENVFHDSFHVAEEKEKLRKEKGALAIRSRLRASLLVIVLLSASLEQQGRR